MGSGTPAMGWNLNEALKQIVPQALLAEYLDALHAWQDAGSPRRPPIFSRYMDSDRAVSLRRAALSDWRLIRQKDASWNKVLTVFLIELRSGRYLAMGRPNSPNVEPIPILSSSWDHVTRRNWERSLVVIAGKPPTHFYDVRISPAPARLVDEKEVAKIGDETAFRKLLESDMRKSPLQRLKPRHQYLEDARKRGIGLVGFRRVLRAAIENTGAVAWSRPGPIRKKAAAGDRNT